MGLVLSAIAFLGTHFLMSHPLRAPLVRAMGEGPFRGVYSLIAILTFGAMIYFYGKIGREPQLWDVGEAGWIAGTLLMGDCVAEMAKLPDKSVDMVPRMASIV